MAAAKKSGRNRPALWTALGFGAGLALAHCVTLPIPLLLILGFVLVLATLIVVLKRWRAPWLFLALVLVLGALRYQTATLLLPNNHIKRIGLFGEKGIFRGRVVEEPERHAERTRFALDLEEVETPSALYRVSGRVLVSAREVEVGTGYGDWIALQGRLQRPRPARNPGGFDYRGFLALQHIHGLLYLRRPDQIVDVEERPGSTLYEYGVLPIRQAIRQTIQRNLKGAPAGLLQGMLLGEKHRIPEESRESFRSTGLAHALMLGTKDLCREQPSPNSYHPNTDIEFSSFQSHVIPVYEFVNTHTFIKPCQG